MRNLLVILIIATLGFSFGAFAGGSILYFILFMVSQIIEDKTSMGWVWILFILVVPMTAVLGSIIALIYSKKWINKRSMGTNPRNKNY